MANPAPVIVWFRQDLRLTDNPALDAATREGRPILPIYILDDENAAEWRMGAASRWWLQQSLGSLNKSLQNRMLFLRGDAGTVLPELIRDVGAESVYWNRCYEPWRIARDTGIKDGLLNDSIAVKSFNGSVLFEPPNTNKPDGTPYRVFTPFYRRGCLENGIPPRQPLPAADAITLFETDAGVSLEELDLMPDIHWHDGVADEWSPGEAGATDRLREFLGDGLFAPNSRFRAQVTPARRGKRTLGDSSAPGPEAHRAMTWARRLKRVFRIDVEKCERCGGAMRIIACIEQPEVLEWILRHLQNTGAPAGEGRPQADRAAAAPL